MISAETGGLSESLKSPQPDIAQAKDDREPAPFTVRPRHSSTAWKLREQAIVGTRKKDIVVSTLPLLPLLIPTGLERQAGVASRPDSLVYSELKPAEAVPYSCSTSSLNASACSLLASCTPKPITHAEEPHPTRTVVRTLVEEITAWMHESGAPGDGNGQANSAWSSYRELDNADDFSRFLSRLRESWEYKTAQLRPGFQRRVCDLLGRIEPQERAGLRQECFAQGAIAADSCGACAVLAFMMMETLCAGAAMSFVETGP